MKISRKVYFIAFITILIIEVIIALYVHDNFIRPYVGDILAIICIYFLAKTVFLEKIKNLSLYILLFSIMVEFIQYFQIFNNLTKNNYILKIILGATFDVKDIICYIIGYLIIIGLERYLTNKAKWGVETMKKKSVDNPIF